MHATSTEAYLVVYKVPNMWQNLSQVPIMSENGHWLDWLVAVYCSISFAAFILLAKFGKKIKIEIKEKEVISEVFYCQKWIF